MTRVRLDHLRRYAAARTLGRPTTLVRAVRRLGFVQADPIRAPARAQDLMLRHRVTGYRAGDLEARYPRLPLEEEYLVNYGFVPRDVAALLHPRDSTRPWADGAEAHADELRDIVRRRRIVRPRDVVHDAASRTVVNAWGGRSNAVTALLDQMHYRGMLRVARRTGGHRHFALARHGHAGAPPPADDERADALVDLLVGLYAPLPSRTLTQLVSMLRWGAPGLAHRGALAAALARARERLPHADVEGTRWYWPDGEDPTSRRWRPADRVRLLAPFDPVVWDRTRFALVWGWEYRFEAYVPAAKRVLGYYALPVLWREHVVGWCNVTVAGGRVLPEIGWVAGSAPRDDGFASALDDEMESLAAFLGLG